jgi:hypothetical protein
MNVTFTAAELVFGTKAPANQSKMPKFGRFDDPKDAEEEDESDENEEVSTNEEAEG